MSGEIVRIIPCTTPRLRHRFERCAEVLNGHVGAFVPPFPGSVAKVLEPSSGFCSRHGEIFPFLAVRRGRTVGRIAAIVNRSHNSYHNDTVGFFGFFECEDEPRTAHALFAEVSNLLGLKGFEVLRGPYNPSINDECGLLVSGFEYRPTIGLTWNPPHYDKLLRACGLAPVLKSHGFHLPLRKLDPPARLKPLAERVAKRTNARLRPIDLTRLGEEMEIVRDVYNSTLERNWGFVPVTSEDFMAAAEEMKAIANPSLILIAEREGQVAGVALALPDINEFLHATKRIPRFLRPLQLLLLLKAHRPRGCRQVVYGIVPSCRDRGLHGWMTYEHFVESRVRMEWATLGWIQENNTEVLETARLVGGEQRYTWSIFEKVLTPRGSPHRP